MKTYLSFTINKKLFAVDVDNVLEVPDTQKITFVPNTADEIKGIINFRGEFLPVLEYRKKFNLPERDENEPFVIIVLDLSRDNETYRISIIADKVTNVISFPDDEIQDIPVLNNQINDEYFTGIINLDNEYIFIIDAEKTFINNETAIINQDLVK
jgi:purine-binding chemotaxis protein CheW